MKQWYVMMALYADGRQQVLFVCSISVVPKSWRGQVTVTAQSIFHECGIFVGSDCHLYCFKGNNSISR